MRAESRPSAYSFSCRSDLEDVGLYVFRANNDAAFVFDVAGPERQPGIAGSGGEGDGLALGGECCRLSPLFDFRLNSRASLRPNHRIPPLIFINS